jgi:hypothetical protein
MKKKNGTGYLMLNPRMVFAPTLNVNFFSGKIEALWIIGVFLDLRLIIRIFHNASLMPITAPVKPGSARMGGARLEFDNGGKV